MQRVNKSISCNTLKDLLKIIEKIDNKKDIKAYNFNGSKNIENKIENYTMSWIENEEF